MGKSETELRILSAARCEFLAKGYEGARMRSIAERAEINKGLLHYYFKSKEALLIEVFHETFQELFSAMSGALSHDKNLFEKIEATVATYTDFMLKHPELPAFIINEMSRGKATQISRMKKAGVEPPLAVFEKSLEEAKLRGIVRSDIDPEHLILNMISLILFPIISKPMVKYMHKKNESEYRQMMECRKSSISQFIINAIKA